MSTDTLSGYSATRDANGVLTIHHVPIFVECERGEFIADAAWIEQAVSVAMHNAEEGYFPPLHIRHHELGADVRPAGWFRITGTEVITFKGDDRLAVFADLVITDTEAQEDVLAARLPYRSVEIFDRDNPSIDSLALLDHEAPYLQLPMLVVAGPARHQYSTVAHATFANPWRDRVTNGAASPVACFRHGRSAFLVFQDQSSMTTKKTEATETKVDTPDLLAETQDAAPDVAMADDGEKKDDEKSEDMEAEAPAMDVGAICKAIKDGSISVADMAEIMAAIEEQTAEQEPEVEEVEEAPAPAPAPGETMSADSDEAITLAKLAGENAALRARLDERDAKDQRRDDVAVALKRLDGRPMGADLEGKLQKFHAEHGAKAFKAYVDSLVENFPALGGIDGRAEAFAANMPSTDPIAMKYQDQGADAVAKAGRHIAEYDELRRSGLRMSKEAYVTSHMSR
jgi:hypothetical protein